MKRFIGIFIIVIAVAIFAAMLATNETKNAPSEYAEIVATSFPAYDFARNITKDTGLNVQLMLTPGSDLHNYEPTPEDLVYFNKSKVVIATCGNSEKWFENILDYVYPENTKILCMASYVELLEENNEHIFEEDDEQQDDDVFYDELYDDHVWTSPKNAIKIVNGLANDMKAVFLDKSDNLEQNAADYTAKIQSLDDSFMELAKTATKPIIVADRFPFYYFVHDYGFDYYAAFPGCVEESEASASTIASLIDLVKQNHISIIYTIELSSQKTAKAIAESTGAKIQTLHSAHNVSLKDFENGVTYYDLMNFNLETLKEALK